MNINLTLIGQMITFSLFVAFTMKFIWPPITKALRERQEKIADGLAAAEQSQLELLNAKSTAEKMIKEAKQSVEAHLAQAEKQAAAYLEKAKADARTEAEKIIVLAQANIEVERNNTKVLLQKDAAEFALLALKKLLTETSQNDLRFHEALVSEFFTEKRALS